LLLHTAAAAAAPASARRLPDRALQKIAFSQTDFQFYYVVV
jgi:hypothetical protein